MFRCVRMAVAMLGILSAQAPAATFINFNGSTGVFGNDMVASGSFTDVIDLGLLAPGEYLISATISSTFQDGQQADQDIDFTSVQFNGIDFTTGSTGQNEYRFVNNIASGNSNLFTINGTSGANSSYSGTVNVAAIPEPSTWAMAIIGFGAVGMAARRRRSMQIGLLQAI
jgi:hypothetical protein